VVYVGFSDASEEEGEREKEKEVQGEYRLAWLWVEGWRARLRSAGDVVERSR